MRYDSPNVGWSGYRMESQCRWTVDHQACWTRAWFHGLHSVDIPQESGDTTCPGISRIPDIERDHRLGNVDCDEGRKYFQQCSCKEYCDSCDHFTLCAGSSYAHCYKKISGYCVNRHLS